MADSVLRPPRVGHQRLVVAGTHDQVLHVTPSQTWAKEIDNTALVEFKSVVIWTNIFTFF